MPPASHPSTLESLSARRRRAAAICKALHKLYADADTALRHRSPLELLVSTILSAQCTDERVNRVTPSVFKRYKSARDFAGADPADLEELIRSTGFFRNKTKNIIGAGRVITDRFNGRVPDTMEELLEVPGVSRKTANVVLGTWFKKNVGFVVDTHVGRLAHRLGLSWRSRNNKDAVKIEKDLMEVFPQREWTYLGHALIWHGRKVCPSRKPDCERCTLSKWCPSAFSFDANPAAARPQRKRKKRT
ncbi:MAG: endonuclease III [Phycisphaerae bacterium]|nr:endonuclease III [Phycisphaerae bacterium]